MQSLVFSPRTHCKVPLIFSVVALPDKSKHFCSSASEITHQETKEKGEIEAKKKKKNIYTTPAMFEHPTCI